MTIFIVENPLQTAILLDPKRLNKQILECQWMIDMATGKTKPSNHPAFLMYKNHISWVKQYQECLKCYREYVKNPEKNNKLLEEAIYHSNEANKVNYP